MRLCISGWRRWGGVFDIPGKRGQVAALQKKTESPDFWNDPKAAEVFMKNLNGVKSWVTGFDKASTEVDDLDVLYDFAKESLGGSTDETVTTAETQELDESYSKAVEDVEALELRNMLGAEGDNLGAVLTINSGAGGTEANDWSSMLMRMYMRWGERNGYKVTVTDLLEGDEAGIKSATIQVEATMPTAISRLRMVCTDSCAFLRSTPRASARPHSRPFSSILWSMTRSTSR